MFSLDFLKGSSWFQENGYLIVSVLASLIVYSQ